MTISYRVERKNKRQTLLGDFDTVEAAIDALRKAMARERRRASTEFYVFRDCKLVLTVLWTKDGWRDFGLWA